MLLTLKLNHVYYLHEVVFGKRIGRNVVLALLFLLVTGATHVLDLGVAVLALMLYFALAVLFNVNRRLVVKHLGLLAALTGTSAVAAGIAFPSLFTDFAKGLVFLQDLFADSGEANPLFFLLDPRGCGFIMPVLAVGVVWIVYEWKIKKREAFLALVAVTAIGFMLSLPVIPSEWLWRFLLIEFIPIAVILGYSVSKMERKVAVTILLVITIFPIVIQGVEASKWMAPTINENSYSELVAISSVLPSNSIIVVEPRIMYWVEYIFRCHTVRRPSPTLWESYAHILVLVQKTPPPSKLPPGLILFEGVEFLLIELPSVST